MQMKNYLLDTFHYNDATNKKLLVKISSLPDKSECIRFFSHLINSQYKWMARSMHDPKAPQMSWWDPVYPFDKLEEEWNKSLQLWLDERRDLWRGALLAGAAIAGLAAFSKMKHSNR